MDYIGKISPNYGVYIMVTDIASARSVTPERQVHRLLDGDIVTQLWYQVFLSTFEVALSFLWTKWTRPLLTSRAPWGTACYSSAQHTTRKGVQAMKTHPTIFTIFIPLWISFEFTSFLNAAGEIPFRIFLSKGNTSPCLGGTPSLHDSHLSCLDVPFCFLLPM